MGVRLQHGLAFAVERTIGPSLQVTRVRIEPSDRHHELDSVEGVMSIELSIPRPECGLRTLSGRQPLTVVPDEDYSSIRLGSFRCVRTVFHLQAVDMRLACKQNNSLDCVTSDVEPGIRWFGDL